MTSPTPAERDLYRKKPALVHAFQIGSRYLYPDWLQDAITANDVVTFGVAENDGWGEPFDSANVTTLHGVAHAARGDWIIKGEAGDLWPCKGSIFEATYESARAALASSPASPEAETDEMSLQWKFECFIDFATGGKLSKSSWSLETLKSAVHEHWNQLHADWDEADREDDTEAPAVPSPAPSLTDAGRAPIEYVLRAMALNYTERHSWDHLDKDACLRGADEIRRLKAALAAPVAQPETSVPKGYKLVPIEPTDEMVYAGASEEMSVGDPYGERRHEYREYSVGDAGARAAYAAMIAAAPSQPEPGEGA